MPDMTDAFDAARYYAQLDDAARHRMVRALVRIARLQGVGNLDILEWWAMRGLTRSVSRTFVPKTLGLPSVAWPYVAVLLENLRVDTLRLPDLCGAVSDMDMTGMVGEPLGRLTMLANACRLQVRPWLQRWKRLPHVGAKRIERQWHLNGMVASLHCGTMYFVPSNHSMWSMPMMELALKVARQKAAPCLTELDMHLQATMA